MLNSLMKSRAFKTRLKTALRAFEMNFLINISIKQ